MSGTGPLGMKTNSSRGRGLGGSSGITAVVTKAKIRMKRRGKQPSPTKARERSKRRRLLGALEVMPSARSPRKSHETQPYQREWVSRQPTDATKNGRKTHSCNRQRSPPISLACPCSIVAGTTKQSSQHRRHRTITMSHGWRRVCAVFSGACHENTTCSKNRNRSHPFAETVGQGLGQLEGGALLALAPRCSHAGVKCACVD